MGLMCAHLFADGDGETHFVDVELPTEPVGGSPVAVLMVPTQKMTYTEYPTERPEIMPGFHTAPARQFIVSLRGGFEVTTTTGESRVVQHGDWIFFDDLGSKGHVTKEVGTEPRINLVLEVADDWAFPSK